MPYTQDKRIIAIETPLGKDVLLLKGFAGEEGISRLFRFDLDLLSEEASINFDDIVGKNVTLKVQLADGKSERYFNGIIADFLKAEMTCASPITRPKWCHGPGF